MRSSSLDGLAAFALDDFFFALGLVGADFFLVLLLFTGQCLWSPERPTQVAWRTARSAGALIDLSDGPNTNPEFVFAAGEFYHTVVMLLREFRFFVFMGKGDPIFSHACICKKGI